MVLPLSIIYLNEPAIAQKTNKDEKHVKAPQIIWILFINTMLMWIIFFFIPVQIPFHLKAIGIEKSALIGAAIATSTVFSAVSSFSYFKDKRQVKFSFYFLCWIPSYGCRICLHFFRRPYVLVVIAMILSGLGMGMMIPNTNVWVMKIAPPEIRGKEIGKLTTFWFLASSYLQLLFSRF